MTIHEEKAIELRKAGANCSQAVLAAFGDLTGIDEETALKLALGFGGGIGDLREVCGAVSGMIMAADAIYGVGNLDKAGKAAQYALARELVAAFKEEHEEIRCGELLGLPGTKTGDAIAAGTRERKKHSCDELVYCAVRILDKYIEEHPVA